MSLAFELYFLMRREIHHHCIQYNVVFLSFTRGCLYFAGNSYVTAVAMGDFYDEAMKAAIAKTKKLEEEYAERMKAKKVRLLKKSG